MAARGTEAKEKITSKILSTFEGSFMDGKVLRIPMIEQGEEVQIKVTLTAAKDLVEHESGPAAPAALDFGDAPTAAETPTPDLTEEEQQNVANLVNALGLKF